MRGPLRFLFAPCAAVLLLAACTAQPETGCIESALLTGFPVIVDADAVPADGLDELMLTACQGGTCRETRLQLTPGSTTVDLGCATPSPGSDPGNAPCSASSSPDGSLVGYWSTTEFTTGPITVKAAAPGFGPHSGTVTGVEVSSGAGACARHAFQTRLHITADGFNPAAG